MRSFHGYESLPPEARSAVIALGNFDGVHVGHQAVLAAARALADQRSAKLGVLTFEPHPRHVFRPGDPPFRLTTPETRARLLEAQGVDFLYTIPFSREFSLKTMTQFEEQVLRDGLGIKGAVVGPNFLYGHNRAGTLTHLEEAGRTHGFAVVKAPIVRDERGEVYSSTRIRQALGDARPDEAAHLLGRHWSIDHTVERGDQRGRQLGFPTANGSLGDLLRPAYGIYAVRAQLTKEAALYNGVASLGIRPMWVTQDPLIETHIFDFDRDIYGQKLHVELVQYLRPEVKFETIEALKTQIAKDCEAARACLR